MNKNQAKSIAERKRSNIMQDQMRVYSDLLSLVEDVLHARIVTDAMWKFKHKRGAKTGFHNPVITFSHVALENFTVQQLCKLFDRKNSVFHVWDVAECLPHPALSAWLEENHKKVMGDEKLIQEWWGTAIKHRGAVAHFASDEYQKKFTEGRTSEKRLHDFLLEFLCQIKFEMQRIPIEKTMEEFRLRLKIFEDHVKLCMNEIYKEI